MNQPPIYVVASTQRIAENFIRSDLQEDPKRLRFIDEPEKLRGLQRVLLYLHPTADHRQNYGHIMHMARHYGCIFAQIDDYYARIKHPGETT